MLHGLFLDPRIWTIDYLSSPFWNPEKHGVSIDLHPNAFNIPKTGIDPKYDFVIATEVWEILMQKTLNYLRAKGLPVFLVPREILPTEAYKGQMFNYEKFKYKDNYYFEPDMLLAISQQYLDLWKGHVKSGAVIGYPRFDIYISKDKMLSRESIFKKYKLDKNKKVIFFPSFPPYHIQTVNNKSVTVDLYDDLQNIMRALEEFVNSKEDVQVIVKIHPMAQKCYNKGTGNGKEVAGLLKKYYKAPTDKIKVIGDERNNGIISKELLVISDTVIAFTSVMLLEAAHHNKSTIHLLFDQASDLKDLPSYSSSFYTVHNNQDLIQALGESLSSSKYIIDDHSVVEKYIYKIDGKFCYRLCDEIKRFMEKKK